MNKTYTHCANCGKKFRKNTEVVKEKAGGQTAVLHVRGSCHYEWLLRFSNNDYFATWEDMAIEENLI